MDSLRVQSVEAFAVAVEPMLSVGLGAAGVERLRRQLAVEQERQGPLDMEHILKGK
jgi:phage FluMu protein gp41